MSKTRRRVNIIAAEDYCITEGIFNLYFALKTKGDEMSDDRKVITKGEIAQMTEWYLRDELENLKEEGLQAPDTIYITKDGKPIIKLTLLDTSNQTP